MARLSQASQVFDAAARWRDRCLADDLSVFTDKDLWTGANFRQLDRYYVQNLDTGQGTFSQKLEKQLSRSSPEAKQLAAELFWVMYLFIKSTWMKGVTKRLQIKEVWEWSGDPLPDSDALGDVLDVGIGAPGTAYNVLRWKELLFLVEFGCAFKQADPSERKQLLGDPWAFGAMLDGIESSESRQLRHILLYLLFPDKYERISTGSQKRKVLKALGADYGMSVNGVDSLSWLDLDQALLSLRGKMSPGFDGEFDFYAEGVKERWRVKEPTPGPYPSKKPQVNGQEIAMRFGNARFWLVAPGNNAHAWDEFRDEGMVAIGWDYLGDLSEYESKEDISGSMRNENELAGTPINDALACWQFSHEVQVGDYVISKQGRRKLLGYGRITSEYRHESERDVLKNVRDVAWERTGEWTVPQDMQMSVKTVTECTTSHEWLTAAMELMDGQATSPDHTDSITYSTRDALHDLFMPPSFLEGILDALRRKRNVVLEGPPGVGKTFVARRLGWVLMGSKDKDRMEVVQFHQSYAYEDFVEGLRPGANGGFELTPGVFLRFCRKATQDSQRPYVLIIDEINRANLSKVFGELMMLIEPDKRGKEYAIRLTYSPGGEPFYVPENLYVIGTMNTADRSLALVDYALRRRFSFIRLQPRFGYDEFQRFLLDAGASEALVQKVVERINALNLAIRSDTKNLGPGFEIGHSYFVPMDTDEDLDDGWFERVVRLEVEPLLHEYWFDQPSRVQDAVNALLA